MAGHLQRAGHRVTVCNRSTEKSERWAATYGGRWAASAAEAAEGASVVLACVGNDGDVRAVTTGAGGAFSTMAPGAVFVDHTTTSAGLAREVAAAATEPRLAFLDAPVSGGQAGAEAGTLTVMAGGDESAFARVAPLLECYARSKRLLGPSGAGQLTKMANQICIAGLLQGLAEGLHFAAAAGLDREAVVAVISKGASQSWQMDHRAATMIAGDYDFGFAVDWMRKDLGFVLAEAARVGVDLPVAALVDGFYADVQAMGGARWDTSSLLARLEARRR
jgi:3-hydroxyisobutyrate dehydrogenase-like beta-hydroxyacid dehydrogenase